MKWLLWFDLPVMLGFAAAVVLNGWAWDVRHVAGMALAAIGFALWFTARLHSTLGKRQILASNEIKNNAEPAQKQRPVSDRNEK